MRPIDCAHCGEGHPSIAGVKACGLKVQEQRREWLADELLAMAGEQR